MILALETSTRKASLALAPEEGGAVLWERTFETDRAHNSEIFGPVAEVLEEYGNRIARLAVGLGPGTYGGIRVAIAVANGLSLARGWEQQGISSLEAFGHEEEDFFVIGDARRKTFFLAEIRSGSLLGEPDLLTAGDLQNRLDQAGPERKVFSAEDSVLEQFPAASRSFPSASRIAARALLAPAGQSGGGALEPHYLRAPYITVPRGTSSP